MATIYLRSTDGSDSDDGSTWALAKATLAAAMTAAGAGGTIYVSSSHAETYTTNTTLASPGTASSPLKIICVDDTSGEPPTVLATGASWRLDTNHNITLSTTGFTYWYGVTIGTASGALNRFVSFGNTQNNYAEVFDNCTISFLNTNLGNVSTGTVSNVKATGLTVFRNCTISFSSVNPGFVLDHKVRFIGCTFSGTGFSNPFAARSSQSTDLHLDVRGSDLSIFGSGHNIFDASKSSSAKACFSDCKLGASVTLASGSIPALGGSEVEFINCDSADTNYRYYKKVYQGEIFHEATIVRTGGASDGTTPISRKVVSTANANFFAPIESAPIVVWNETTGSSITATVEVVTDNVTLTDAEAWIEVEYLGTSGFPLSSIASDRAADILATPANQTSSSATWTTTGLTTPVKQKLSVSFTPQEKGPIKIRVMLAKASTTMYFCPKADIT